MYLKLKLFATTRNGNIFDNSILDSTGKFPVYSSATRNDGLVGYLDEYIIDSEFDGDGNIVTWTKAGAYAGTFFLRDGKFNMTIQCEALLIKEEFKSKINTTYLFWYIKTFLENSIKSKANGGALPRVNWYNIENNEVFLPSMKDQIEIINIIKPLQDIEDTLSSEIKNQSKLDEMFNLLLKKYIPE